MEFGTALIVWFFLVFVFDFDGTWTAIILFLIVAVSPGEKGIDVSVNIDSTPARQEIIEPAKPKIDMKPVTDYGNVKQEYVDNSKRSSDVVEIVNINGKVMACNAKDDNLCFDNPSFKKHLDGVLYACDTNLCYKVK